MSEIVAIAPCPPGWFAVFSHGNGEGGTEYERDPVVVWALVRTEYGDTIVEGCCSVSGEICRCKADLYGLQEYEYAPLNLAEPQHSEAKSAS